MLLLTTTSFSITAHFCGDNIVDIALNNEAQSCAIQDTDPEMHNLMKDMGCCNDKQIVSDSDVDLQKSDFEFSFDQLVFINAFTYSYANLFDLENESISTHWIKESPPLIGRDLFLLHDSFLI